MSAVTGYGAIRIGPALFVCPKFPHRGNAGRRVGEKPMQEQKRTTPHRVIIPKRMEIWYARLERHTDSSVQGGNRPVLIISNDINNSVSSVVTVLPMTSKPKKLYLPTHTWIDSSKLTRVEGEDEELGGGLILAEQITTIDKERLVYRMGELKDKALITLIEKSVIAQLGVGDI